MTTTTAPAFTVTAVKGRPIEHYTGARLTRVTRAAVAITSDGREVPCEHTHGHTSGPALRACAIALVARLNREARA